MFDPGRVRLLQDEAGGPGGAVGDEEAEAVCARFIVWTLRRSPPGSHLTRAMYSYDSGSTSTQVVPGPCDPDDADADLGVGRPAFG